MLAAMDPTPPRGDPGPLLTRQSLLAQGRSEAELRAAARRSGPLVVVRRGVYVDRSRWEAADEDVRARWRDRAVHLTLKREHRLSHDSAARLWDLPLLQVDEPLVHVTRTGVRGSRVEHGVKHHLAHGLLGSTTHAGVPTTGLARTALDLAREHGHRHGAVAAVDVLRRGVPHSDLESVAKSMWCWPESAAVRRALLYADPGCESPGEVLTLELVSSLGLGTPRTQVAVRLADGRVVWCDIVVGCHVVESDGKVKYARVEDGGVATRPPHEVAWDERRRERKLLELGLGVSRVVWSDHWGRARAAAADRLREEIRETHARTGTQLPAEIVELNARLRPARVPWAYGSLQRGVPGALPGFDH